MNYLEKYGIPRFINAHDTITLYGASRMSDQVYEAMHQISSCFTDILELQKILGKKIAQMTHNEGAYIAGSAAGALQLAAAVAMCEDDEYAYRRLPDTDMCKDEIIILHGQYHCYVTAMESAGAKLKLIGDADEVILDDLDRSIGCKTAAVLYTSAQPFQKASPSLEAIVEITHRHHIPVIVDAAAQLPPVSNLWTFCERGADMVIFSGGKSLMGPQTSGLIVGKQQYMKRCIRYGSPNHGICRSSKTSREDMIGLCVAIEEYLAKDHEKEYEKWSNMADQMATKLKTDDCQPIRVESGSVGQTYPRVFLNLKGGIDAKDLQKKMYEHHIFVGCSSKENQIYLSPQNMTEEECDIVIKTLKKLLSS